MRPRKLLLRNFGCFRGEHEIDFTQLASDLFAIAGPTGSGKSTLLDALTWALYGQTPRLGRQLNEHIFSPGETDLSVVLEFSAGDHEYRATRALRRRPSGISPAAKLERRSSDGRWLTIPETDKLGEYEKALQGIVGLDYDGYVRAVMLPQGAFDEFLRGNDAERREVIKALLKAYTIEKMRDLAVKQKQDAKGLLDQALARIGHEYEGVTQGREAELEERLRALAGELESLRSQHAEAAASLKALDALEGFDGERRAAEAELARLAAAEGAVLTARAALERAAAAEAIAPLVRVLRSRERDLATVAARVEELGRQAAADRERRDRAQARSEAALTQRSQRQPELRRRLTELEEGRRDAVLLKRHGATADLAARSDGGEFDEERLNDVLGMTSRLGELRQLERAAAAAERELRARESALARGREAVARHAAQLDQVLARGKRQSRAAEAARQRLDEARVANQAATLRAHLHEGRECPVCLNVVSSVPESGAAVDLGVLEAEAETAQAELTKLREDHARYKQLLASERDKVAELERGIAEEHGPRATAARAELEGALAPFAGHGSTEEAIRESLAAASQAELARLARRLTAVTGGRDFEALVAETTEALSSLDAAVEAAQKELSEAEAELAATTARLETTQAQETAGRASLREAQADLDAALGRSRFGSLEEVEAASLTADEQSRMRERVEANEEERRVAEAKRAAAAAGLAGRAYDPVEHAQVRAQAEELQTRIELASSDLGRAQQELEALRERLADLEALKAQAAEHEKRYGVLHSLEQALRSNQFEAYVLGHALADLAVNASVIINELTDGRYELDYDGEFYVRDTWMDSHRRSVKTLSGGESFIVSLALALALADTVAGQQSLGALFLDEGFGTLDPDSLDSVTEVLTNLTGSGRMVGVITHVTSLTERLPARLLVGKGQLGSSLTWDT